MGPSINNVTNLGGGEHTFVTICNEGEKRRFKKCDVTSKSSSTSSVACSNGGSVTL